MQHGLPVTETETFLPEGEFIYSRTDLNSKIVEANEAFARISAYEREEMLGQPHNLVRHPDMPAEAFADMWADLKAGRPWRGVVKNRRKDGGFYWVIANASPVRENGRIVGYQSVRTRPSREEIKQAAEAYRRLRQGDRSLRIEHGRIKRVPSAWRKNLTSIHAQMGLVGVLALLLAATVLLASFLPFLLQWAAALAVLAGLSALYFLLFTIPSTRRDLNEIAKNMEYVLVSGDLTRRSFLSRNDPIGMISRRFDIVVSSFQATMQGIGDAALHVGVSTQAVASRVHEVNQSALVQGEATAAAAAAVEEVTVAIGEVAAHAGATREASLRSGTAARKGAEQSAEASATVLTLADTVRNSAAQVEALGRRSAEISLITGVIKEIADQTNLLALNAAIEAARAGETGRGFAVVADEVRKLAERTGKATQEISTMAAAISGETNNAVVGMQSGAVQVESGVQMVTGAKQALDEINTEMSRTVEMVAEISHATSEQQMAMTELSGNINRVSEMTEKNLQVVLEADMQTRQLDVTVERMLKAVGQYSV